MDYNNIQTSLLALSQIPDPKVLHSTTEIKHATIYLATAVCYYPQTHLQGLRLFIAAQPLRQISQKLHRTRWKETQFLQVARPRRLAHRKATLLYQSPSRVRCS